MQEKVWYKSKKLWYAVATGLVAALREGGIAFPEEMIWAGLALIFGQGLADLGKNKPEAPAAPPGAPAAGAAVEAAEKKPAPLTLAEYMEPFDILGFQDAVVKRAKDTYGKDNYSNQYHSAIDLGMSTRCSHIEQALDYWTYLVGLSDKAFTQTWGYDYASALANVGAPGCPNCKDGCGGYNDLKTKAGFLGAEFYGAYLDYNRSRDTLAELAEVNARGIDWRNKLYPQHYTLYHLGELAKYMI